MTRVKPLKRAIAQPMFKKLVILAGLFCGAIVLVWGLDSFMRSEFYYSLERFAFWVGESYDRWFSQQTTTNPLLLLLLSFAGGLIASISPCILSLLPVNLSYIGTREITSRRDAFWKATAFVLGVVTVLSLLGLFSALAGVVFVKFRGYFHLAVGSIILLMGLTLAGIVRIPLPQNRWLKPSNQVAAPHTRWSVLGQVTKAFFTGPYGVGLTFALVSSPCTSPVMFSVLAAAAATGSQVQSTLMMVSYALGYTAIIFFASLFTGLAKQTRTLLLHSDLVIRVASLVLLLVGTFYVLNGSQWILAMLA